MFKGILLLTLSLFLFACEENSESSLTQLSDQTVIAENNHSSASYPIPQSLNSIEEKADLILKVRMKGHIEIGNSGSIEEGGRRTSSLSEVEIADIYKGDKSIGDKIVVTELFYFNDDEIEVVEHYVPMENNEEYILFLSNWDEESWRIEYMGYGKYHVAKGALEDDFQNFSILEDVRSYSFITEEEDQVLLYETIREEVINKYVE